MLVSRFPGQAGIRRELHALLRAASGQASVQQHASAFPVLAEAGASLSPEDVQFWAPAPLLQVQQPLYQSWLGQLMTSCRWWNLLVRVWRGPAW